VPQCDDGGHFPPILKVEIGGDTNSTDGSESSIEHASGTVNCGNGYNYTDAELTAYINWPLIASIYPDLPHSDVGLILASQPWSGAYGVGESLWATAQVTQFTAPGWQCKAPSWTCGPATADRTSSGASPEAPRR
jgi:hypothetical protein